MKSSIPIDKAGRLVLPKHMRTLLNLHAGDLLDAIVSGNEVRLMRRHSSKSGFHRHNGRLVWDAPDASASLEEIEQAVVRGRNERDARVLEI